MALDPLQYVIVGQGLQIDLNMSLGPFSTAPQDKMDTHVGVFKGRESLYVSLF